MWSLPCSLGRCVPSGERFSGRLKWDLFGRSDCLICQLDSDTVIKRQSIYLVGGLFGFGVVCVSCRWHAYTCTRNIIIKYTCWSISLSVCLYVSVCKICILCLAVGVLLLLVLLLTPIVLLFLFRFVLARIQPTRLTGR